jgi:hypothetical protein
LYGAGIFCSVAIGISMILSIVRAGRVVAFTTEVFVCGLGGLYKL